MKADGEQVELLLARLCRLHHARAQVALEKIGLYRGQPHLLRLLWEREGRSHGELAAAMGVAPATVTRMIQRMERAGFVERRRDPADERLSRVYLTRRGRAVRQEVERILLDLQEKALAGLQGQERRTLRRLLAKMLATLERARP